MICCLWRVGQPLSLPSSTTPVPTHVRTRERLEGVERRGAQHVDGHVADPGERKGGEEVRGDGDGPIPFGGGVVVVGGLVNEWCVMETGMERCMTDRTDALGWVVGEAQLAEGALREVRPQEEDGCRGRGVGV